MNICLTIAKQFEKSYKDLDDIVTIKKCKGNHCIGLAVKEYVDNFRGNKKLIINSDEWIDIINHMTRDELEYKINQTKLLNKELVEAWKR